MRFGTPCIALSALVSLGASCGNKADETPQVAPAATAAATPTSKPSGGRVDDIPGVDISKLTDDEQSAFKDLANEQLSPCGEPVSVARCVAEQSKCRKCPPAGRYLARLVAAGFEKTEIQKMYLDRFGSKGRVDIDVAGAPVRGAPMAPVTVIEFSDFECPHCGRAHPMIESALAELKGKVRLVFMHYPLSGHVHAQPAARAAVAAGHQGKFWEMHDILFAHQEALEDSDLRKYAQELGLDMAKFDADFASPEVQKVVESDRAKGDKVGVEGTPTMFINGRLFGESAETLVDYVREELEL